MDQFGDKSKKKLNSAEFMEFVFSMSGEGSCKTFNTKFFSSSKSAYGRQRISLERPKKIACGGDKMDRDGRTEIATIRKNWPKGLFFENKQI